MATAGAVELPSGFEVVSTPSLGRGPDKITFTPEETADIARQEANPEYDSELALEIAKAKGDPKKLAILQAEQQARGTQTQQFIPAAYSTSGPELPPGFEVAAPTKNADPFAQLYSDKPIKAGPKTNAEVGTAEYILNQAKVGLTAGLGGFLGDVLSLVPRRGPLEAPGEYINPITLGLHIAAMAQDVGSEPGKPKGGTSADLASKLLGYNEKMEAPSEGARFAGRVAEFAASGVTGPTRSLLKEGVAPALKSAAEIAGVSTAAAAGTTLGEETGGPLGGFVGGLLSIPAYAYARKLPNVWAFARNLFSPQTREQAMTAGEEFLGPLVRQKAEADLAKALQEQGPERAVANIKEAAGVQGEINRALEGTGKQVTLTAGQMSGARRVIDAELEARRASYSANEASKLQTEKNATAIVSYIKAPEAPLSVTIKQAIDKGNQEFNAALEAKRLESDQIRNRAAALTSTLPVARTAEERGIKLGNLAIEEKIREDVVKDKIYNAVAVEADKINARFDPSLIDQSAQKLMANPILKYDATNTPTVISKIADIHAGPQNKIIVPGQAPDPRISFRDIQAMETAVNQDIASELASAGPNTGQRIRALKEMKEAIQGSVAESDYTNLKKLYQAATSYYRDSYSPRFNTGINAKLWMRDNYGDNKILDENILTQYTKNKNNMNRFVSLFGKNPEAMAVMQDHIYDTYRNTVVRDGAIDMARHQKFLADNADALSVLQKSGLPAVGKLSDVKAVAQKLADRQAELVTQEKSIAESQLYKALQTRNVDEIAATAMRDPAAMGRLTKALGEQGSRALASKVMRDIQERITYAPQSGKVGLNSAAMAKILQDNDKQLRILFRAAYGPEEGAAHLQRLKTAYQMMALQDRVKLPSGVTEPSSVGTDPLKQSTGVSLASLWSMLRAVTRGVNSPQNVAIVLGGQAGSFYLNRAYNNLIQSIATNPESSKDLLRLAKVGSVQAPTKADMLERAKAMANLLGRAGYFWVGGRYYGPSLSRIVPGLTATLEEETRQQQTQ